MKFVLVAVATIFIFNFVLVSGHPEEDNNGFGSLAPEVARLGELSLRKSQTGTVRRKVLRRSRRLKKAAGPAKLTRRKIGERNRKVKKVRIEKRKRIIRYRDLIKKGGNWIKIGRLLGKRGKKKEGNKWIQKGVALIRKAKDKLEKLKKEKGIVDKRKGKKGAKRKERNSKKKNNSKRKEERNRALAYARSLINKGQKLVKTGRVKEGKGLIKDGIDLIRKVTKSYKKGKKIKPPKMITQRPSLTKRALHNRMQNCKNMERHNKKVFAKGAQLIKAGKIKKGRKLIQAAKLASKQIKQLNDAYKLIQRGKYLMQHGRKKDGIRLVKKGVAIEMALGSGAYIRLPGFQTLNASRKPKLAPPILPESCQCKVDDGPQNGKCWIFNDKNQRTCLSRRCKPKYICVSGVETGMICVRKINFKKVVSIGAGFCREINAKSVMYVPYSTK